MRIASVTMIGQFPDGIGLHVRNLRWSLSIDDCIYIITTNNNIINYKLKDDDRVTYIDFGACDDIRNWIPFWRAFAGIVTERRIDPEWFLFMEQDIWFHERIAGDPPPGPKEIRSHLPLHDDYHSVLLDGHLHHPRVWEGSTLIHGPLVRRAMDFGIDFSAHEDWFINKDRAYWDGLVGGTLSLGEYEHGDTMDEFALYCALVERTRMTHCQRAVHLQGPEALHRNSPEVYCGCEEGKLSAMAERWSYYFCFHAAVAVYYIAGNWERGVDWRRMQRRFRPGFEKVLRTGREWMKPEEYERLESIVADFS
jgi:hypothetical protein